MKKTTIAAQLGLLLLFCLFCQAFITKTASAQSCKAGFTYTSQDSIAFFAADTSNANNKVYLWDFGDGKSSYFSIKKPVHFYPLSGSYNVCLKVWDTITNCRDTFCANVDIKSCYARFGSSRLNNRITFYNNSQTKYTKFFWDFGDFTTSNQANPIHYYSNGGTYLVTLVMQDTVNNCTDTTKSYVYPRDLYSTCKAGFTYSLNGNVINITNTSITNETAISYVKFGNGDSSIITGYTSYGFMQNGKYDVCLITKDTAINCTDTFCAQVVIENCIADFSYSGSGKTFSFTNKSSDPNASFVWNFGDGKSSTAVNPQHTYTGTGPFYVSLIMDNTKCMDTVWRAVSLCRPSFTYTTKDSIAYFTADSASLDNKRFYWSFGSYNKINPTIKAHQPGRFRICLFAYDTITNCNDSFCTEVEISMCNAKFTASVQNNKVIFTNQTFKTSTRKYTWNFGDSTFSNQENPTHAYSNGGTYLVTLIIQDSATNCIDTFSAYVNPKDLLNTCKADFSYFVNGYEITITNNSILNESGQGYIYFGNGDSALIDSSLKYKYAYSGSYNVCLITKDPFINCTDTFCKNVSITVCEADFSYSRNDKSFSFTNRSSYPNASYLWDFGDGNTSTAVNPQHTYSGNGPYEVSLVMTNSATNCSDTIKKGLSSCKANFGYTIEGKKVSFHDSSFVVSGGKYYWKYRFYNFQNDGNSILQNPVEYFYKGGRYYVVLIVTDSANTCMDSVMKIIDLPACEASFGYQQEFESVKFINYTQDKSNCSFVWDFGDSSTSTQESPTHKYTKPGSYKVTLAMQNNSTLCMDSTVHYNYVVASPCYNDFWYNISGNVVKFFPDTIPYYGNFFNFASYHWDFGDSTSSTQTVPQHSYQKTGKYKVCLTVTGAFCTTKKYLDINIISVSPTYSLSGVVYTGSTIADSNGVDAYLITYDANDSTLSVIDTFRHNFTRKYYPGAYIFQNIKPGKYFVKTALRKSSPQYANYLPTYADTSLRWENAREIVVTNSNVTANINLRAGNNPGGNGFISGKVSQGANKREGDPLVNVLVTLLDENLNPVTYTYSDSSGNFSFSNIPYGKFLVYTEVVGVKTIPAWVTLTEDNPKEDKIEVAIRKKVIITSIRSDDEIPADANITVYPNPVKDQLTIAIDASVTSAAYLIIYDYTGRKIIEETVMPSANAQTININTAQLPAGVYLLQLQLNNDLMRQFKIVK